MSQDAIILTTTIAGFLSMLLVQGVAIIRERRYAEMARLTPDRPKTVKPRFSPPGQGLGMFKCGYCGRFGKPGACEGCGAPNEPASALDRHFPDIPLGSVIRSGMMTPNEVRRLLDLPALGESLVPAFPMVKR